MTQKKFPGPELGETVEFIDRRGRLSRAEGFLIGLLGKDVEVINPDSTSPFSSFLP